MGAACALSTASIKELVELRLVILVRLSPLELARAPVLITALASVLAHFIALTEALFSVIITRHRSLLTPPGILTRTVHAVARPSILQKPVVLR